MDSRRRGVKAWTLWELPPWLAAFVVTVVIINAVAFGVALSFLRFNLHDVELFCALLVCSAATVELTRRAGENLGFVKDVHAVWELPVAVLLPFAYVPIAPAIRFAMTQWRVRRVPTYRRVFSASAISLSYFAVGLVFRGLEHLTDTSAGTPLHHPFAWMLMVAVCGVVQWAVNQALVLTAVKGSSPDVKLREVQFAREPMFNDLTELCVAVVVTFSVAASLIALVFAFPFVSLLQRSLRHGQLLTESRLDSKTGLLNAATWEREASAEAGRAVRTRSSMAVMLLDLDHFKLVNDTYGHLVGDQALRQVAGAVTEALREYDLAGRFGGEEFSVLLPQTRAVDALRIAERLRAHIAGLRILQTNETGTVTVTVSIGVAALDAGSHRELPDLMAMADAALYRAKSCGRDQVQMISTTRGLSAVRPSDQLDVVAPEAGTSSSARISEFPVWHSEASPVLRTLGVGYPWQVQPSTVSGAPPPLPLSSPFLMAVA
jgi:diguanylate cyclase (GGDEF)-like protein